MDVCALHPKRELKGGEALRHAEEVFCRLFGIGDGELSTLGSCRKDVRQVGTS